jgi:hypothetical protein
MGYFARHISDERAGQWLSRAVAGRGAFRRFRDQLHERYPDLLPSWHALHNTRALRRAVAWLAGHNLVDTDAADRFYAEHPDPALP